MCIAIVCALVYYKWEKKKTAVPRPALCAESHAHHNSKIFTLFALAAVAAIPPPSKPLFSYCHSDDFSATDDINTFLCVFFSSLLCVCVHYYCRCLCSLIISFGRPCLCLYATIVCVSSYIVAIVGVGHKHLVDVQYALLFPSRNLFSRKWLFRVLLEIVDDVFSNNNNKTYIYFLLFLAITIVC